MSAKTEIHQQAAAIAIRRSGDSYEVCLIRRASRRWGIPKGFVDLGYTPEQTALNEAWEEAGLRGRLLGDVVGIYEYAKWDMRLRVKVYLMEVLEEHAVWQEAGIRERRWFSREAATSRLKDHPVRPLLRQVKRFASRLG